MYLANPDFTEAVFLAQVTAGFAATGSGKEALKKLEIEDNFIGFLGLGCQKINISPIQIFREAVFLAQVAAHAITGSGKEALENLDNILELFENLTFIRPRIEVMSWAEQDKLGQVSC